MQTSARVVIPSSGTSLSHGRLFQGQRRAMRPQRHITVRPSAFQEEEKRKEPYTINTAETGLVPAFTRRRERQVGRLALLGCACAFAGEQLTGLGPLTQLSYETGMPMNLVYGVTATLAAFQLVLGVNQFSPTFDNANQRDVGRRSKGITGVTPIEPDTDQRISLFRDPGKFLLRNELVLGRAAMLIFVSACVLEFIWNGQSPLAHVGLITPGAPLAASPLWLKLVGGLFLVSGLGVLSGFDSRKDADTY